MNKAELIRGMAVTAEITKEQADDALARIIYEIQTNDKVNLPGLGIFKLKRRAARTGRNPRTGEEVPIPARTVLTFRASGH